MLLYIILFPHQADAFDDSAGLDVVAVTSGNGIQVKNFTQDAIAPTLTRFVLNMNTGQLLLTFDEPMDPNAVM